jgi:formate hydrogenlyase subunit 3/multisubunit Na+/H+ antiporter MnhD subunit
MSGMFELVLPPVILVAGAFLIYLITRGFRLPNRVEALLTVVALIAALVVLVIQFQEMPTLLEDQNAYYGVDEPDGILLMPSAQGGFILIVALFIGILVTVYSGEYLSNDSRYLAFYPMVLLLLAGLMGMFLSSNLFTLFLLTELVTVTASALIAFRKDKYLVMSSLGTLIMLLGVYFIYRETNDLNLVQAFSAPNHFTRIGAACFLLGFGLKAGVVPLHTWVPDVYGYACNSVSALLAGVVSKSMLFIMPAICLRLGMTVRELGIILMILACFNMLIGSVRMLGSRHIGRFLSYSSIAQTGYLMFTLGIGFYYHLDQAISAGLFLYLSIAIMKSQAFLSAGTFQYALHTQDLDQLEGVHRVLPRQAFCFSVALAGLAGIPLLAGFTGKWLAFSAAAAAGDLFALLCLLVFMASTLIGLAGYLPVLVRQYLPRKGRMVTLPETDGPLKVSHWMTAPVMFLSLLIVVLGVFPGPWIDWIEQVVKWMAL